MTLRRSRTQDAAQVRAASRTQAKPHRYLFDPDESIDEIFAEVCRRRCPSGRRLLAPQRTKDFRIAHHRENFTGADGTSFGGGGRLWSEAQPACLEVAASHLKGFRIFEGAGCSRGGAELLLVDDLVGSK